MDATFNMTLSQQTKANMIRNGTVTEVGEDVVFLATSNDITAIILRKVQMGTWCSQNIRAHKVKLTWRILNHYYP